MSEPAARSGSRGEQREFTPEAPIPHTRLIGREHELARLQHLFSDTDCRLLTITGIGGVGKTRIARAFAQSLAISAPSVFVALADVRDAAHVPTAILRAMHVDIIPGSDISETMIHQLRGQPLMLVLDNLEHLNLSEFIASLLRSCPDLKLVTTSRIPLGVVGEHLLPLEPLQLPENDAPDAIRDSPAVQLFVDRVRAVLPALQITAQRLQEIGEICRLVDGIPLALELAAANCRQVAPHELAHRLRKRAHLATFASGELPARHQTMEATVQWSVDLLSEEAGKLWRALGIMEGGWTVAGAEAVSEIAEIPRARVPSLLDQLEMHGLINLSTNQLGEPRYRMLHLTREVALDALQQDPVLPKLREAHAHYVLEFSEIAQPGLKGPDGMTWFLRVEAELANIRAVFRRNIAAHQLQPALDIATNLDWFWTDPGYLHEGYEWISSLLSLDISRAKPEALAAAHSALSSLANWLGYQDEARDHATTALTLCQQTGDQAAAMNAMLHLGNFALDVAEYDTAWHWFEQGHAIATQLQDLWAMPAFANLMAMVAAAKQDCATARNWHHAAIEGWRANGYSSHVAIAESSLAWLHLVHDEDREAIELLRSLLPRIDHTVTTAEMTTFLVDCAILASKLASGSLAVELFGVAARIRKELGSPHRPYIEEDIAIRLNTLRSALGDASFSLAWNRGSAIPLPSACDLVAELVELGTMHKLLTLREREVLSLLARGLSDHEIADMLYITRRTASKHVAAILEKLGAANRTTAVAIAYREHLVVP